MSHTRSECTCRTPDLQKALDARDSAGLRRGEWQTHVARMLRTRRLTRRFTDFPLDAYEAL